MPNLPSYPSPPGANVEAIGTTPVGPTSYTAVTNGTPSTGGQVLNAKDLGLTSIEFIEFGTSGNGQYTAHAIFDTNNPLYGTTSVRLRWLTAATGAEVSGPTNLSTYSLRFRAVGRY
jgi:hypothetical protein